MEMKTEIMRVEVVDLGEEEEEEEGEGLEDEAVSECVPQRCVM